MTRKRGLTSGCAQPAVASNASFPASRRAPACTSGAPAFTSSPRSRKFKALSCFRILIRSPLRSTFSCMTTRKCSHGNGAPVAIRTACRLATRAVSNRRRESYPRLENVPPCHLAKIAKPSRVERSNRRQIFSRTNCFAQHAAKGFFQRNANGRQRLTMRIDFRNGLIQRQSLRCGFSGVDLSPTAAEFRHSLTTGNARRFQIGTSRFRRSMNSASNAMASARCRAGDANVNRGFTNGNRCRGDESLLPRDRDAFSEISSSRRRISRPAISG